MKRFVLAALLVLLAAVMAFGQTLALTPSVDSLKATVESEYTVVAGDTLSLISAKVYGDYRYWPVIFLTNKSNVFNNPEVIEPGMMLKIYKLPFKISGIDAVSKLLLAEVYLQTYEAYLSLGADWINARRWVLLESLFVNEDLFSKSNPRVEASDSNWYGSR